MRIKVGIYSISLPTEFQHIIHNGTHRAKWPFIVAMKYMCSFAGKNFTAFFCKTDNIELIFIYNIRNGLS